MTEYLFTIREMSKIMETSPAGLKDLRSQGIGPRHVIERGRVLYPESGLAAWKRACEQATA